MIKMANYLLISFMLLSLSKSFCLADEESLGLDENGTDDDTLFHQQLYNLIQENAALAQNHMDLKMAELMDFMEARFASKQESILNILTEMQTEKKMKELCEPGICGDHGVCGLSDDMSTYQCDCESGFIGEHCEEYVCPPGICGGHGACVISEDGNSGLCHCNDGYAGEHCEISGPCAVELYDLQQTAPMPGLELPRCEEDGYYQGMQYIGSTAYCVTIGGEGIEGYSVPRWETGEDMNCQCARDEYYATTSVFNCAPNGNYPQTACDAEQCWCQDKFGQQYGEPVPIGDLSTKLSC